MAKRQYSAFHFLFQKFGSTQLGSWFSARTLHHMDRAFLKLTQGRTTLSSILVGLPEVMVTTVGAKSGLLRTLPLACIRDESNPKNFALIASNWGQHHNPAWYYNLKACPHGRCTFFGQTGEYAAHEAIGEEYEKYWQLAVDTYIGYPLYQQRGGGRHIPIMVMSPEQQQTI
jgi:deazaflavin-dependent oxidoreductase (nitroreductase family)